MDLKGATDLTGSVGRAGGTGCAMTAGAGLLIGCVPDCGVVGVMVCCAGVAREGATTGVAGAGWGRGASGGVLAVLACAVDAAIADATGVDAAGVEAAAEAIGADAMRISRGAVTVI